ncbi:50S ribosomal protein L20 [Pseudomonas aeruginosa]|nr:50S ribosomal protein L20 [Pseudomonas aeruginosa]
MARVKRGVIARRRHKKILKLAKGYYGARSRVFRVAKQAVIKAGQYAYRDRRQRKRQFRALWIARINAGGSSERSVLQPSDRRPEKGGHRDRP